MSGGLLTHSCGICRETILTDGVTANPLCIKCKTSSAKANRNNKGKPQLSLLPREALEQEAKVWEFGANKYSKDNWKKLWGEDTVSVCIDSAFRHLLAISDGIVYDEESGLPHAAHVRCNMAMILEYYKQVEFYLKDQTK